MSTPGRPMGESPSAPRAALVFCAAEASGDLLAAPVVTALRARHGDLAIGGVAGDRMVAAGAHAWHHIRELSVRGYVEVLRELPRLLALRRALRDRVLAERARVFVGVDAPDFNLKLEAWLRGAGVPTVHYVSPSIWAWRRERIEQIRRAAARVLLVFPFEQKIYDDAGIAATYVGHPLASQIPATPDAAGARVRLGLSDAGPLVALLPGSRRAEVQHIAPAFLGAAALLAQRDQSMRFVLPIADASLRPIVDRVLAQLGSAADRLRERLHVIDGRSHDCLEAADGVLVASGTATLEAALFQRPMVIGYAMPRVSWWLMKNRGYLPWVGLPNILAGTSLVPELLQDDMTPAALADALTRQLDGHAARLRDAFGAMHAALKRDTAQLAAAAIASEAGL